MSSRVLNLLPGAVGATPTVTEYAQIAAPAPVSFNDLLHIVFPDWSTEFSFAVPWDAAHGTTLPTVGADALIVKDSRGERRCVYWDSPTTAFVATSIAGLTAGGGLAGTYPNPTLKLVTGAAWVTPTLINSWAAFTPVGYLKDPLGFVHMKGIVTSGVSATVAFVLPAGFRPGQFVQMAAGTGGGGATASMSVNTSGNVTLTGTPSAGIGFDGVSFLAEN